MRGRRTARVIILISVAMLLLFFFTPIAAIYLLVNEHVEYSGVNTSAMALQKVYIPEDFELDANEFTIETEDSLELWVSEVPVEDAKALIIYLTGIKQPSVTYFYGHSKWMKENGYATFLLEVRAHGKSEGKKIGLGYEETKDVKALIDYIKQQEMYNDVPIILHGVSMGGAIAINSFGMYEDIDALIAMSAYSSFEDIIYDYLRIRNVPHFIASAGKSLTRMGLRCNYGNKVLTVKPEMLIKNANRRPVMLIASKGDFEVPYQNTERLYAAAGEGCQVWLRETWEHFIIKDNDFVNLQEDAEYCSAILTFLETRVMLDD